MEEQSNGTRDCIHPDRTGLFVKCHAVQQTSDLPRLPTMSVLWINQDSTYPALYCAMRVFRDLHAMCSCCRVMNDAQSRSEDPQFVYKLASHNAWTCQYVALILL